MKKHAKKASRREHRTSAELSDLLHNLTGLTVSELQRLYEEFSGETTRSRNKPSLIKRVSAQIQMRLEKDREKALVSDSTAGTFDDESRSAESNKIRSENKSKQETAATPSSEPKIKTKKRRERDPRLPAPGTVLWREYRGVRHEVTVLENGFIYNDEHFGSLSMIARHIAGGTSWNGFLFFQRALSQISAER